MIFTFLIYNLVVYLSQRSYVILIIMLIQDEFELSVKDEKSTCLRLLHLPNNSDSLPLFQIYTSRLYDQC